MVSKKPRAWEFHRGKKRLSVNVTGRLIVNDGLTYVALFAAGNGIAQLIDLTIEPLLKSGKLINLARPRLRPTRGIRQFDSARRGAAGFSGLANGGTEILMRGKCLGAISILRLLFHWRVPAEVTPIKIE